MCFYDEEENWMLPITDITLKKKLNYFIDKSGLDARISGSGRQLDDVIQTAYHLLLLKMMMVTSISSSF